MPTKYGRAKRSTGFSFANNCSRPRYNSVVFQSLTSFDYTIGVVKDSFLNGTSFSVQNAHERAVGDWTFTEITVVPRINPPNNNYTEVIEGMRESALRSDPPWLRYNVSACFDHYDDYFAPQANGLIFVKNESIQYPEDDSLLLYVSVIPRSDDWAKNLCKPFCTALPRVLFSPGRIGPQDNSNSTSGALENGTYPTKGLAQSLEGPVTRWFLGQAQYEVDYCLLQQAPWSEKKCQLEYSPWILWIVCFFNLTKMTVIFIIWRSNRQTRLKKMTQPAPDAPSVDEPLDTLGDAIASFMRSPDTKTKGFSFASSRDFRKPWRLFWRGGGSEPSPVVREPSPWKAQEKRWMHAADVQRWVLFLLT